MTGLADRWERFWFSPEETSTLAIVRIAFGLVALTWTITLAHDGYGFFSGEGILPDTSFEDGGQLVWSVLDVFEGRTAVAVLLAVMVAACVSLTIGQFTRLAAVVVFVGLVSFERRNPFVFNSGDALLRLIAFYLMLAPSGASLSLDRLRRDRAEFWRFPSRYPWALRLMQVQLSVLYLSGLWAKLGGPTWNDGTAVSYAVRLEDLARFELPGWIATSEAAANLLTYGTLATEAAVGILVWNRRLRPWVLGAGVALHLGIDLTLRVGFFSYGVWVLYLAFLPPEVASGAVRALRDKVAARLGRRPRRALGVEARGEHPLA